MRIAVLNLTGHPLPLFAGLPRAGTQIINWLSTELPEAEFYSVSIEADNEELPEPDNFDGLIVSGSEQECMIAGHGWHLYATSSLKLSRLANRFTAFASDIK